MGSVKLKMNSQFKIKTFEDFKSLLFIIRRLHDAFDYFGNGLYFPNKLISLEYIKTCESELKDVMNDLEKYHEVVENVEIKYALVNFSEIILKIRKLLNNIENIQNFERVKDEIYTHLYDIYECSELVVYSIITERVEEDLKIKLSELNDLEL